MDFDDDAVAQLDGLQGLVLDYLLEHRRLMQQAGDEALTALQAMLAGGGGGDRGGGGGGPIDMNYQWLRAIIHEGARRACGPPS
jgi:hypothetical protein